jgi:hypothetical protein
MSPLSSSPAARDSVLRAGLFALAAVQFVQGLLLVAVPGAFYDAVANFGPRNTHDLRDIAAFYLASAPLLAIAARRPSWRTPVLALVGLQFALHALNHVLDVGRAEPSWIGPADVVALAAGALLIAALLRASMRAEASA